MAVVWFAGRAGRSLALRRVGAGRGAEPVCVQRPGRRAQCSEQWAAGVHGGAESGC